MTCVECGKQATFWLCSSACALTYAKGRGRRDCAICSYDEKTGRIGRHDTIKICSECRRRAENGGWVIGRDELPDENAEVMDDANRRLRDQQDRPLPPITPLATEIVRLIVEGERVAIAYKDKKGRARGVKYRWRAYTVRRLAAKLGCSRMVVQRVIDSIEK